MISVKEITPENSSWLNSYSPSLRKSLI